MLRILLNMDGKTINKEAVEHYKINHNENIDAPDTNPFSEDYECTLLSFAINSEKIPADVRLNLVSYLINETHANVNDRNTLNNGNLVESAFKKNELELASLLQRKDAHLNSNNLIAITLETKDRHKLDWIIKNANSIFMEMKTGQFIECIRKIKETFPDDKNNELGKSLDEITKHYSKLAKENLIEKFSAISFIGSNDAAYALAAKMSKKDRDNSIFSIDLDDINALTGGIKMLLENETSDEVIKFQLVIFSHNHAVFGEFEIDKTASPAVVRFTHCDPVPPLTHYNQIITPDFKEIILPLAKIEVYDSNLQLHKSKSCVYFSLDGAMKMSTPTDRSYVSSVRDYIKNHAINSFSSDNSNFSYIQSDSLPPRFVTGSQIMDDTILDNPRMKRLSSLLFHENAKDIIVNKKGETAEQAAKKNLKHSPSKLNRDRMINERMEVKMKGFKKEIEELIKDKNILSPDFVEFIDQYKIKGLMQFCEGKILANEKKIKI